MTLSDKPTDAPDLSARFAAARARGVRFPGDVPPRVFELQVLERDQIVKTYSANDPSEYVALRRVARAEIDHATQMLREVVRVAGGVTRLPERDELREIAAAESMLLRQKVAAQDAT